MTKEEWAQVEEQLKHQFNSVTLVCDGYRLQLQLSRISNMSLGITFYVNGWMRGKWFLNDCEERKRFFRSRAVPVYSARQKKLFRGHTAKFLKAHQIDLKKTFTVHSFYWTSFRALKAHLIKHNQSIELLPSVTAAIPPGGHLEI